MNFNQLQQFKEALNHGVLPWGLTADVIVAMICFIAFALIIVWLNANDKK